MIRTLTALLIALCLTLSPLHAQTASASLDTYPTALNDQNPYAQALPAAKAAYEAARTRYDQAYRQAGWGWAYYQAYYRAYYELWNAYARYVWYVRAYWYHERTRPSRGVTGVVLARPVYGILPANPPAGFFDPRPVSGATVQLFRTDLYTIAIYPPPRPAPVRTAVTDANGRFTFSDLEFTKGRIQVTYANHRTESQEFTVTQGTSSLRIVLEYNGPPVPVANGGLSTDDINRR